MAFSQQNPREFTRREIEALSPNWDGVYGLFKPEIWIYIGKGNLRQRLLAHFNGDNSCITSWAPTHFVIEVTPNLDERERQLLSEIQTKCNQRIG
jgi:hypothetical protein